MTAQGVPGGKNPGGKEYIEVNRASAVKQIEDNCIVSVIVSIGDSLGTNPKKNGTAYIIQTYGSTVALKEAVDFECLYDGNDDDSVLACVVNIDREIFYEEGSNYYICFEEGAISSDSAVNLPIEIKL